LSCPPARFAAVEKFSETAMPPSSRGERGSAICCCRRWRRTPRRRGASLQAVSTPPSPSRSEVCRRAEPPRCPWLPRRSCLVTAAHMPNYVSDIAVSKEIAGCRRPARTVVAQTRCSRFIVPRAEEAPGYKSAALPLRGYRCLVRRHCPARSVAGSRAAAFSVPARPPEPLS